METKMRSPLLPLIRCVVLLIVLPGMLHAQDDLRQKVRAIAQSATGDVGVAIRFSGDASDSVTWNGLNHYPMQSTYKFAQGFYILSLVDKGTFTLNQKILVQKKDLLPDTHSPLRDKYPQGNVHITLRELLKYSVSESDNNACDILFRLVGGTRPVYEFVQSLGIQDMAIAATEEEMSRAWDVQFTNWCTPLAMLQLLEKFQSRKELLPTSADYLWKMMAETKTKPNRLKGLLPAGTIVAHKTGTSGTTTEGVTAATNDVGIIRLPRNKYVIITVFIKNATGDDATRDAIIARIARAAYDHYNR